MPEINWLLALFLAGLGFFPLIAMLDRNNVEPARRAGSREHTKHFNGA